MKAKLGRSGGFKALAVAMFLAISLSGVTQAHAQPDPQEGVDALTERIDAATEQLQEAIDTKVELVQRAADEAPGALDAKVERLEQLIAAGERAIDRAVERIEGGADYSQAAIERAVERAEALAEEAQERADGLLAYLLNAVEEITNYALGTVDNVSDQAVKLLRGEQGALTTVSNVLCPTVRDLDDLIDEHLRIPGVGEITGALATLVCTLGILEFQFQTTWVAPDGGTITRFHDAMLGVPTHMNVDAEPGPDIVGELNLAGGLGYLEMTVDKLDPAQELPLSVEAVFSDTADAALGVNHMAVGYDTTHDQAPGGFVLSAPLEMLMSPSGEYSFSMQQFGLTEEIALIASTFDGTPVDREEDLSFRLDYGNAPGWAQLNATLQDAISIEMLANTSGPASISAEFEENSAFIEFEDLPEELRLTLAPDADGISYDASAPMDRLEASLSTADPFFLGANHFEFRMLDVPQQFDMTVGQDVDAIQFATTNPIGQLDLRARSEAQAFPEIPAGEAGAILNATNDELALALRVFGLRELGVTLDPIGLFADLEGGHVFTADVQIEQTDENDLPIGTISAEVILDQMPSQVSLSVDDESGAINYQASDTMDRLAANVSTPEPVFLGAEHFEFEALEVPASFELGIGQEDDAIELSTDNPIGQLDLRARSDNEAFPEIPAGETGAVLRAVSDELALALRVLGLQQLSVNLDPISLVADLEGGHVFTADVEIEQTDENDVPIGSIVAEAILDAMPSQVSLAIDDETGEVSYQASDTMDRLFAQVSTPEPLLLGAEEFLIEALEVPEAFSLAVGQETDELNLSSDEPIGQLDLKARSADQSFPEIPSGEAGAILDSVNDELALALRIFGLQHLGATFDPIGLTVHHEGGRVFTIDARLDQEDDDGLPLDPVEAFVLIDTIPDQLSLELGDLPEPPDGPGGAALNLSSSDPVDFARIAVEGLELFEGADVVEAEINQIPTEIDLTLPEGEGEPLALIQANDHIGQLRLAASDGSGELPERSIAGDPVLNDLFRFKDLPSEFEVALRLSVVEALGVNLDPVNLSLEQDGDNTRPIDLDAGLEVGGDDVSLEGILDRPRDSMSLGVEIEEDEPVRLVFDNSHHMELFDVTASGLGGIDSIDGSFENLSPRFSICMEDGPGCQRTNPHNLSVNQPHNNRPYPAEVSIDLEDFGTHGTSTHTTINADVALPGQPPVTMENVRVRNLGMDFGQGPDFSGLCTVGQSAPRLYMFFDSRSHPWVMNDIVFPPLIESFRIGTDTNPARAANRIAALVGCTGFLGSSLNRQQAGGMSCGGQAVLNTQLGFLGTVNILNVPLIGSLINLCGGTVPNPQPW